jgi:hypothetical protein
MPKQKNPNTNRDSPKDLRARQRQKLSSVIDRLEDEVAKLNSLGYLGFVVTRFKADEAQIRKTYSIYNDSQPKRKVILLLSDEALIHMIDMKCLGHNPMKYIQNLYRNFRTSVQ